MVATGNFAGEGLDTCAAPAQASMDAWRAKYQGVGIYISGGLRACAQPNLTADWVSTNASKGWQFLLVDVGLQAPCTNYSSRMSSVAATALTQGRNAAINAVTAAPVARLRPAERDLQRYRGLHVDGRLQGRGAVLPERLDAGTEFARLCRWRVRRRRLRWRDLASAYASTAYTRPDNLWFAHWKSVPVGTSRFIPAADWTNHQRVHQYDGDVSDTVGGVTMSIDKDYVNLTAPPPPVESFSVTGGAAVAATAVSRPNRPTRHSDRSWSGVRSVATPPPLPTSGTAVYNGTASLFTATGLSNSASYAYRVWVKDSKGKTGPGVDVRLVGTKATIGATAASITYTGSVTLSTTVTRLDGAAKLSGVPVVLYSKAKNATKWTTLAQLTSDANGVVTSVQKPAVSTYYMWGYNGAVGLLGTRSSAALVEVHPAISAYLTPAAIKLGASTVMYGYLNPPHAGTTGVPPSGGRGRPGSR